MWRSAMSRSGILLFVVLCSALSAIAWAQSVNRVEPPIKLGKRQCTYLPKAEGKSRSMFCHIGRTLVFRTDSAGVGQGVKPGLKLVVIGATTCSYAKVAGHAPVEMCMIGNQEYALDSTGVGEGSGVTANFDSTGVGPGTDSTGVGEGSLSLDYSNCKWVILASTLHRVLQCTFGPLVIYIDSTGVGEGTIKTASRR